jgi:hypothetical protein
MKQRKTVVGLMMLCALVVSAVVAQGAQAKGQTAFTCAPTTNGGPGFSDAHCDNAVETGAKFVHAVIAPGTITNITLTNAAVTNETKDPEPAVLSLTGPLHGVNAVTVTCTTVAGTGTMENVAGPPMEAKGEGTIKFSGCTTNATNCTTPNTIEAKVKGHSVETADGMGLKFEPKGTNFAELNFAGTGCALKPFTNIPVAGNVTGTAHGEPNGSGATAYFLANVEGKPAMEALTVGGVAADITGIVTLKGENGNALTLTTEA